MHKLPRPVLYFVVLLLCTLGAMPASAQSAASGFELALHGDTRVVAGSAARFRGVAYRVRGLAELQPLASARVRARYSAELTRSAAWVELGADRTGFFQIDVPMPSHSEGAASLEISIGDGKDERLFSFPLSFQSPWKVDVMTDRRLYEPGETIHAWLRLRDGQSRRPGAGRDVSFTLSGAGVKNLVRKTGASGVASAKVTIPKEAKEGAYEFIAEIDGRTFRRSYKIGTRSYERLFTELKVSPARASPEQEIKVSVKVTTASGALVRNAQIKVTIGTSNAYGQTDAKGMATVLMRAPAYLEGTSGSVSVVAAVAHPAHGETKAFANLGLEVPLTLSVEAVPSNGALVPGIASVLYLRLSKGDGKPPALGTAIEATGAAFAGGLARGKTDKNGFVTIPTRLPRGAASGDEDRAVTTVIVHIKGTAPRTASLEIDVARAVEVAPSVDKAVVAPGETLTISLRRRPGVAKLAVIVELLSDTGIIEARRVAPGVSQVKMKAPTDRLGVIRVRARPLHQKSVVEGTGSVDAFLVRPPHPSFPTLTADKEVYKVGTTANLTLDAAPGASKSWVALLVRDLAAHAGETPFQMHFLARAFDKAILDPAANSSNTLLRTALADWVYLDPSPIKAPALLDALGAEEAEGYDLGSSRERGLLRDPYPLADELSRRGVGEVMRQIERLLSEALDDGRLSELVARSGNRSNFRARIFEDFEEHPLSLGEGELTLPMLFAADPSFSYNNVGKRVARQRLVQLLVALAVYLDPGDDATLLQRAAAREPSDRWLSRMVERGLIEAEDLADPWGGSFTLRRTKNPALSIAIEAASLELVSPGPDGTLGTRDDIFDPFARAVPAGTAYAIASGEDRLMAQLARLAPGAEVLRRLLEAYQRVTAEVAEEEIGDAVGASVSEGWGTIGTGAYGTVGSGGGSGMGYGSGRGGLRGRSSRAPSVRVGSASTSGGVSGFASVVRERFPSTLYFAPAIAVDPSGKTKLRLPLSEAVTTYLVEAVVWSADGWTWSTKMKIRVDKETVIDAPVPTYATVGDVIRLPVRIGNRSSSDRRLDVAVFAPGKQDAPMAERKGVLVPGKDAVVEVVDLKLTTATKGSITVGVRSPQGVALDAVRRPITVQRAARRVRKSVDILAGATKAGSKAEGKADVLRLSVDERAIEREGSQVLIRVGAGLFELAPKASMSQWAAAWTGEVKLDRRMMQGLASHTTAALALSVGVTWAHKGVDDLSMAEALRSLTAALDQTGQIDDKEERLSSRATALILLAPATRDINARRPLDEDLQAVLRKLRKDVQSTVAEVSGNPKLWAQVAAALALTAPKGHKLARVRELVRRVRRHILVVGPHTWVATASGVHETSALLALAELRLGAQKRGLALLRTLAKLAQTKRLKRPLIMAYARVAAEEASPGGPPSQINLHVDGKTRRVPLDGGVARVPLPELSRPGVHSISVDTGASAPALYYLEATSEHGLPWGVVPKTAGSIVASIDGEIGAVGRQGKLVLTVRNRSPRTISNPIVELSLPAGTELDDSAKREIRRHTRGASEATRGTLRLRLAGLPPGSKRKISLGFRWSVGGKLQGLGIASFPENRPDDISIVSPRVLSIHAAKVAP